MSANPADHGANPLDAASNMNSSYVRVVLIELTVLAALWWLQRAFA